MSGQPTNSDERKRQGWLGKLCRFFPVKKQSDTIIGEVGHGARGVAIGKNIIQIGTMVVPALPLLVLIGLVSAGFIFQRLRSRGQTEMTGEFNVVIAEFGQVDTDGKVKSSTDGWNLSSWLFGRLRREYETLPSELGVMVWHDSLDLGVELGIVTGSTPQERAAAAAELADEVNADIVVYGNLAVNGDSAHFVPEFFVAELPDATELIGSYQLGSPIPVQLPIGTLPEKLALNSTLSARTKVLVLFTLGLAWEFAGDPARALDQFRTAEGIQDWPNEEGRELLYLFIGREAYFLWREGEAREVEVLAAFREALRLNPDYGRAYVGLGNFYREKAEREYDYILELIDSGVSDSAELTQVITRFEKDADLAIETYLQALDVAPLQPQGQVAVKAHLALGGVHSRQGSLHFKRQQYHLAKHFFDQALVENEKALALAANDDYRHLAQAQLGIGVAYYQKANLRLLRADLEANDIQTLAWFDASIAAYSQCITYTDANYVDWYLQELKTEYCLPYREAAQTSLDALVGGEE